MDLSVRRGPANCVATREDCTRSGAQGGAVTTAPHHGKSPVHLHPGKTIADTGRVKRARCWETSSAPYKRLLSADRAPRLPISWSEIVRRSLGEGGHERTTKQNRARSRARLIEGCLVYWFTSSGTRPSSRQNCRSLPMAAVHLRRPCRARRGGLHRRQKPCALPRSHAARTGGRTLRSDRRSA